VGLAQAPGRPCGLGRRDDRAPARRVPAGLGPVAGGAGRVRGPGAPGRGAARRQRPPGRAAQAVAVRPDGDGLPPEHGPVDRLVRRGRQALRRARRHLPVPARQPQGQRREEQPLGRAALVAHPARRVVRRAGPGVAGRVLRPCRRQPSPPARRRTHHGRRARAGRAAVAAATGVPRHRHGRAGGQRAGARGVPGQPLLRPARPGRLERARVAPPG
jgi:hypothetical protein